MLLHPESSYVADYLSDSDIIDTGHPAVAAAAERLKSSAGSETDLARITYNFVRDEISHSADAGLQRITFTASEVLESTHGICFAKSHLLAALLRRNGIPAGFCYQLLRVGDDASALVLHGLNGVYNREEQKWIRLDARGNKAGVSARFSLDEEILAFPVRERLGEIDYPTIFACPDANVLYALTHFATREELWADLPQKLATR